MKCGTQHQASQCKYRRDKGAENDITVKVAVQYWEMTAVVLPPLKDRSINSSVSQHNNLLMSLWSWPSECFYYSNLQQEQWEAADSSSFHQLIRDNSLNFCTYFSLFLPLLCPCNLHSFVFSRLNPGVLNLGFQPAASLRVVSSCLPGGQSVRAAALHPHCYRRGTWQAAVPSTNCWPCTDLALCQWWAGVRMAARATALTFLAVCWALNFDMSLAGERLQVKSLWILHKIPNLTITFLILTQHAQR